MNDVVKLEQPTQQEPLGIIAQMSQRFGMVPEAFERTVRRMITGDKDLTKEEFAAFLIVCQKYNLNPITREIYAMKKKGGGIQPVVGVDGWAKMVNDREECDGFTFQDRLDDQGNLISITCSIFRKDRSRPTEATEYLKECLMPASDVWAKYPYRMLRHKSLIQAARYAFGFSGVVDPDEADRFIPGHTEVQGARLGSGPPPAPPEEPKPALEPPRGQEPMVPELPAILDRRTKQPEPEDAKFEEVKPEPEPLVSAPDPYKIMDKMIEDFQSAHTGDELDEYHSIYEEELNNLPMAFRTKVESVLGDAYERLRGNEIAQPAPAQPPALAASPFSIPAFFNDTDHFRTWLERLCQSIDLTTKPRAIAAFNATKEWRLENLSTDEQAKAIDDIKAVVAKLTAEQPQEKPQELQPSQLGPADTIPQLLMAEPTDWRQYADLCTRAIEIAMTESELKTFYLGTQNIRTKLGVNKAMWENKLKLKLTSRMDQLKGAA